MKKQYYTTKEAAKILDVDPETVRRWLRNGKIDGLKISRDWRIPAWQIPSFIRQEKDVLDKE